MERAPNLGGVDLPAVLGISLTAETRQRLNDIGHRIDLLRLPADEPGWVYSKGPQAVAGGQPLPLALATALGRHYESGDWLEFVLDVRYARHGALLVTAAVEVACFCPIDHNAHVVAKAEWTARSGAQLLNAFETALGQLVAWSDDAISSDTWRARAHLAPR
jgi:hypothetical protein